MLRPPSVQRSVDYFYSGDPAFVQLPADATDEQRAEHEHKWKVARETGNYSTLLRDGEQPTKFVMQPIARTAWRAFYDRVTQPVGTDGRIGPILASALLFRMSVVSVTGFDAHIRRRPHREWNGWDMAEEEIVDVLEDIDPKIVTEIASLVHDRMSDIPKN